MKAGISTLGERSTHMLCVWHLAKQMPKSIIIEEKELTVNRAKDLLYSAARGTAFTCEMFEKVMKQAPDLFMKFDRVKTQWCRKYSNTQRRDFIATASESLNGAVKRIALDTSQIRLTKAFLAHGMRAFRNVVKRQQN